MRRIATYISLAVLVTAAIAFLTMEFPPWVGIAWPTFCSFGLLFSHWRRRYERKHPIEDDRQYLQTTLMHRAIGFFTVVPLSLLLGWSVDKISQSVGTWPTVAWLILCCILLVPSFLYDWRMERIAGEADRRK